MGRQKNMQRLSSRSFWIFQRIFPLLFFDFEFILGKYQKLICVCEDMLVVMSNVTLQYIMKYLHTECEHKPH